MPHFPKRQKHPSSPPCLDAFSLGTAYERSVNRWLHRRWRTKRAKKAPPEGSA
ncbi:hypothetical protein B8V81_3725 [Paenibacillus pasadenensis]|uniref:Uncharacterized protein n=1 Tax=Paenibacillus pasadenensis TaxID=217090 RepID=A0A2N5N4L5_9BACL|nr:hypothetical protein B8V81_3725 [Paenibacillus pasadenensis]